MDRRTADKRKFEGETGRPWLFGGGEGGAGGNSRGEQDFEAAEDGVGGEERRRRGQVAVEGRSKTSSEADMTRAELEVEKERELKFRLRFPVSANSVMKWRWD